MGVGNGGGEELIVQLEKLDYQFGRWEVLGGVTVAWCVGEALGGSRREVRGGTLSSGEPSSARASQSPPVAPRAS